MTKLWRFLCSLRLAVWCGLILSAMLLVSSLRLISQPELDSLGTPPLLEWLAGQQSLWGVWWIFGLLALGGLFFVNLVCCTIDGLRKVLSSGPGFWRRLPPHIAHLGLIILLAGLTVSAVSGFKLKGITLQPGQWQDIPEANLSLQLTGEGIQVKQAGQVMSYGPPIFNHPIFHNGTSIYFAGEGQQVETIELEVNNDQGSKLIRLNLRQEHPLGPDMSIIWEEFVPDYREGSVAAGYDNPAIRLALRDHGQLSVRKWIYVRFPDYSRLTYKGLDIGLYDIDLAPNMQVDIASNPGAVTALIGCLILVAGLGWCLV